MGLIVAPSCNDCHGVHDIKRTVDRSSPINHANIAGTCGKCHIGVEKDLQRKRPRAAPGQRQKGAVCTDCHSAHQIQTRMAISRAWSALRRVIRPSHALSRHYHGKAIALGRPNDGLGSRRVLRLPWPSMSCRPPIRTRAVEDEHCPACRQCHPANASFTETPPPTRWMPRTIRRFIGHLSS